VHRAAIEQSHGPSLGPWLLGGRDSRGLLLLLLLLLLVLRLLLLLLLLRLLLRLRLLLLLLRLRLLLLRLRRRGGGGGRSRTAALLPCLRAPVASVLASRLVLPCLGRAPQHAASGRLLLLLLRLRLLLRLLLRRRLRLLLRRRRRLFLLRTLDAVVEGHLVRVRG